LPEQERGGDLMTIEAAGYAQVIQREAQGVHTPQGQALQLLFVH